jgi:hypothetical protein
MHAQSHPLLALASALILSGFAHADTAPSPIPFAELGAKATADYKGDAIGISATAEGATLRTGFQKLAGTVTSAGLRLESTEAAGGSLQMTASAVGRVAAPSQSQSYAEQMYSRALARPTSSSAQSPAAPPLDAAQKYSRGSLRGFAAARPTSARAQRQAAPPLEASLRDQRPDGLKAGNTLPLPAMGLVTSTATLVTFTRPGLVEEYSVSADGVRQDFIIAQRPAGSGALNIELAQQLRPLPPAARARLHPHHRRPILI